VPELRPPLHVEEVVVAVAQQITNVEVEITNTESAQKRIELTIAKNELLDIKAEGQLYLTTLRNLNFE